MDPIQQINRQIDNARHTRWAAWCFVGLFVASGLIFAYNRFWPQPEELESHVAAELPKAANIKKKTITGPKQLEVYDRQDLLEKVPVPAEISQNEANQFTATAEIPAMPYGGQAVTYVNYTTYKTGTSLSANKRPLFGIGGKTKIGAVAGVSTRGNMAIGYIGQDVVRIGPINIGVAGGGGTLGNDGVLGGGIHLSGEF